MVPRLTSTNTLKHVGDGVFERTIIDMEDEFTRTRLSVAGVIEVNVVNSVVIYHIRKHRHMAGIAPFREVDIGVFCPGSSSVSGHLVRTWFDARGILPDPDIDVVHSGL